MRGKSYLLSCMPIRLCSSPTFLSSSVAFKVCCDPRLPRSRRIFSPSYGNRLHVGECARLHPFLLGCGVRSALRGSFLPIPWECSLRVRFGRHIPYCILITQHRCAISLHRSSVWPCPEICLRPIRHTLLLMPVRDVALPVPPPTLQCHMN